jgi:hypothetical protein
MAIATSTAIAGASLALTAASTAGSFIQAGKQRDAMRQAEADADTAMKEARKKLETNFYEGLSINKEPYELQREALISSGAQAIQAGVESERGAAATAGRVQMAQNEAQAGVRSEMGKELANLEKITAQEDARLNDIGAQLDLEEVAGAQLKAANSQELAAQAQQQGMEGLVSMGQQAVSQLPLFEKTASTKQFEGLQKDYGQAASAGKLGAAYLDANGKPVSFQNALQIMGKGNAGVGYGFDTSGLGAMKQDAFNAYMSQQGAKNLKSMRKAGFGK